MNHLLGRDRAKLDLLCFIKGTEPTQRTHSQTVQPSMRVLLGQIQLSAVQLIILPPSAEFPLGMT